MKWVLPCILLLLTTLVESFACRTSLNLTDNGDPLCLEYQFGNWTVWWSLHSKCLSGHGTRGGVTWLIRVQGNNTTLNQPGLGVLGNVDSVTSFWCHVFAQG